MGINLRTQDFIVFKKTLVDQYIEERFEQIKHDFSYIQYLLSDSKLYDYIQLCFEKSEAFGFNQRGSAKLYIDFCFIYGINFIDDPQYSWLNTALNETEGESQIFRATDLYERNVAYYDSTDGIERAVILNFNHRLQNLNLDALSQYNKFEVFSKIKTLLSEIYPEKYNQIERQSTDAMIHNIIRKATAENINLQNEEISILALMMFLFGHDFNNNPMYLVFSNNNKYVQSILKQSRTKITNCWLINTQLFYNAYSKNNFLPLQQLAQKG